jgi:hypothetical protein
MRVVLPSVTCTVSKFLLNNPGSSGLKAVVMSKSASKRWNGLTPGVQKHCLSSAQRYASSVFSEGACPWPVTASSIECLATVVGQMCLPSTVASYVGSFRSF